MPKIIVFDVNETLLDLKVLDEPFRKIFGDVRIKSEWFSQLLHASTVVTLTGAYTDFGSVGGHALEIVAKRNGVSLREEDKLLISNTMKNLPPHPEVPESLRRLKDAGLRIAALTNSSQEMVTAQLTNTGIYNLFDIVMSVDGCQKFKPAPEVYQMAAQELKEEPGNLCLVAAHEWDISGAMRCGWSGAFIARPGKVLGPLSVVPEIVGPDLQAVAEQLLK